MGKGRTIPLYVRYGPFPVIQLLNERRLITLSVNSMTSIAGSKQLSKFINKINYYHIIYRIIKISDTLPICKTLLLTAMTDGLGILF